jgi:lipid-binding SYLF domain-containing protein
MRSVNGYTALAAAIGLACGAAWAQDREPGHDPLLQDEHRVEQDVDREVDIARGESDVFERDRDDVADADEISDEIEDQQELAEERREIEQMAESAIEQLRAEEADAAQALDNAYGYAVFDTTKGGLIVTGAGGTGVAKVKDSDEQTFMHVGGAGIGLGAGGENYKLVLVFNDEESYNDFTAGEWEAGGSAQVAAGDEGAAAEALTDDVQLWRLTDVGLIAQVDVTGMRFWPSDDLNEGQDTDVAFR